MGVHERELLLIRVGQTVARHLARRATVSSVQQPSEPPEGKMQMRSSKLILAIAFGCIVTPSAAATSYSDPGFVGTPAVAFLKATSDGRGYALSAVVRFDRALPASGTRVVAARTITTGQRTGSIYGGASPRRIGATSRHCYVIEVGRLKPVDTPKNHAHWRLGVSRSGRIRHTVAVTLARFPADGGFGPSQARTLGCATGAS
jgi:hypothetical protein